MFNQSTSEIMSTEKHLVKILIGLILVFVGSIVIMQLLSNVDAETIIVAQDGSGDNDKIQDAIDNATEGDTVRVWEGTYYENVLVNKRISLVGNGSEVTTIDGGGRGVVVKIIVDWVNIRGFMITGGGSSGTGMIIESNKNTIQNNTIENNKYGIYLSSSSNCTFKDNTMNLNGIIILYDSLGDWNSHTIEITNTVNGKPVYYYKNVTGITVPYGAGQVILANCTWINVENQNCSNGSVGFLIGYSSNITFTNNTCSGNNVYGIYILYSNNCTITKNIGLSNYNGIYLWYSYDSIFMNNTFCYNYNGIYLWYSNDCIFTNNSCSSNDGIGIIITFSINCTIMNNTCENNDGSGIYLHNSNNGTIENNSCSSNNEKGIELISSNWSSIMNNTCNNNVYGTGLRTSNNCTITNSMGNSNIIDGIELRSSNDCTITNNTCNSNNRNGFYLVDTNNSTLAYNICNSNKDYSMELRSSTTCSIKNNIFSNNGHGIHLKDSDQNTITTNIFTNNSGRGVWLANSKSNTLINNLFSNNDFGIYISFLSDCTIENNTISDNSVGIHLESSSQNNSAHYNNIYNNTEYGINAFDNYGYIINATNNYWGATSGPYHTSKNPEGEGDNITDYVVFCPWLEEEYYWLLKAHIDQISPNPAIEGDDVKFSGHGTNAGTIVHFVWRSSINDEFYNGTENEFEISDLSAGTHTIFFRIGNSTGIWSDEVSDTLIVREKPLAYIDSITPETAVEGQTVSFEGYGTDDGSITGYAWRSNGVEFYNGTESEIEYDGLSNGTHTIYFKVQDNHEIWSDEVSDTLTVNGKPLAYIDSISPETAVEGEIISFEGHGTDDGTIGMYVWRTDTLELHNDTHPWFTHSTLSVGSHTIYFKVQDDYGVWSDEVDEILIIHERPIASIASIAPNPGLVGDSITFTAEGTDDGSIEKYAWRMNETELYNGTSANFSISTLQSGIHTVYLKDQDNYGVWSEEVSNILIIHERPLVTIESISPNPAIENATVTFIANGTDDGQVVRYVWREGENELNNGTDAELSTADLAPGTYTISLRVQDNFGVWSEEVSQELAILADGDGDGYADTDDAFPEDPAASKD